MDNNNVNTPEKTTISKPVYNDTTTSDFKIPNDDSQSENSDVIYTPPKATRWTNKVPGPFTDDGRAQLNQNIGKNGRRMVPRAFGRDRYRCMSKSICCHYDCFVTGIIFKYVLFVVSTLLATAIPVAMITIGSVNIEKCPAIPELPILLIVSGSLLAFGSFINIVDELKEGYVYHLIGRAHCNAIDVANALIFLASIIAFMYGCLLVYGYNELAEYHIGSNLTFVNFTNLNSTGNTITVHPLHCDPVLLNFSFWLLNAIWFVIVLFAIIGTIGITIDMSHALRRRDQVNAVMPDYIVTIT